MLFFLILRCTLEGTQLDSSLMRNFTINILFFIVPVAILWFWPGQLGKHFDILSSSSNFEGNEHRRALRSQGETKVSNDWCGKLIAKTFFHTHPYPRFTALYLQFELRCFSYGHTFPTLWRWDVCLALVKIMDGHEVISCAPRTHQASWAFLVFQVYQVIVWANQVYT